MYVEAGEKKIAFFIATCSESVLQLDNGIHAQSTSHTFTCFQVHTRTFTSLFFLMLRYETAYSSKVMALKQKKTTANFLFCI